jgi:hypothetical protein
MAKGKHLTHYCDCGRIIHWPKNRKIGDVWECRYCHTEWTLSNEGQMGSLMDSAGKGVAHNPDYYSASGTTPSHSASPPNQSYAPQSSTGSSSSGGSTSSGSGCLVVLMLVPFSLLCVVVTCVIVGFSILRASESPKPNKTLHPTADNAPV